MAKKLLQATIDDRIGKALDAVYARKGTTWMTAREIAVEVHNGRKPTKKEFARVQRRIQHLYYLGFLVKTGAGSGSVWRLVGKYELTPEGDE